MTVKLAIMYKITLEYLKCQLFAKYDRLRITNSQNPRTIVKKAFAYEEVLNGFARQRWPDYGLIDIKFLFDWRK